MKAALGRLDRHHRFLLVVLGATSFFDGYDRAIVTIALPQIRATYGLAQSDASLWIALIFLGSLPALVLTRRADRLGRRQLLLVSITGYTVAAALTALAPTITTYVACQFVARLFLTAEAAVVWTIAAEELPASARGLGFGWLAMNSALGVGFGAIVYGGIFGPLGVSWRWLYVLGLPALIVVARLRRRLPESRRFRAARDAGALADKWHAILQRPHLRWLVLGMLTALLLELTTQASIFALDFLQTQRGLSASAASFLLVGAGLPGIPLMVAAGSMSDRYGRRAIGCSFGLAGIAGAMCFFWLPGGMLILLPSLMFVLCGQMGAWPSLAAYGTELFPTPLRSQAASWFELARVAGAAASLALGGLLLSLTGGLPPTATLLALGPLTAILIVARSFPDTHGRELETINIAEPRV